MKNNHNEIKEIIPHEKDIVEHFVKNNNETLLKEEVNHERIDTIEKKRDNSRITLFKKFEGSLINFLLYSTIGGLSELGKRKELYLRIFWMIVVFICSSYALVTFIEMIKRFYYYELNLAFDKYQDMPTKFPSITICNQNPFNEQYAFKYLKDKFNFLQDFGYYSVSPESDNISERAQLIFSFNYNKWNVTINELKRTLFNDLNQTELSSMGYDLDSEMLISCQYNGHSCSETNGDFKRFWNNIYGNCYTFNGGNNLYLTGDQHGLHLEMIVSK
jgi:hypothetical protein